MESTEENTTAYSRLFKFLPQDLLKVADKQNRNLIVILFVFMALTSVSFFLDFFKNSAGFNEIKFYNFYLIHICAGLVNLLLAVSAKTLRLGWKIKSLPAYIMNLTYICLNLLSLKAPDLKFYVAAMTFVDFEIACTLLFEMNPMYLTLSVVFIDAAYAASGIDYLQFLNIFSFSVLLIILGWWKRANSVKNLFHIHEIALEKQKNEDLLLNILPLAIVDELKTTGTAKPEKFESVSVLFTDFKSFTATSEKLSPDFVISELNDIFSNFDRIIDQFDCTRIKTIGDAYFAVCGLPVRDEKHAEKLVKCGKAFIEYLEKRNETAKIKWQMRVGINSGAVTAGIVGTKKYLYDIFGDTVNTASRMESNGEPMKVNISESTKNLLGDGFELEERNPVEVKGKGLMTMYFVK